MSWIPIWRYAYSETKYILTMWTLAHPFWQCLPTWCVLRWSKTVSSPCFLWRSLDFCHSSTARLLKNHLIRKQHWHRFFYTHSPLFFSFVAIKQQNVRWDWRNWANVNTLFIAVSPGMCRGEKIFKRQNFELSPKGF